MHAYLLLNPIFWVDMGFVPVAVVLQSLLQVVPETIDILFISIGNSFDETLQYASHAYFTYEEEQKLLASITH